MSNGRNTVSMKLDTASLKAQLEQLGSAIDQAARPAAQAAAQVLYDTVKMNVGKIKRKTGNLSSAIYQAYSKTASVNGRQVYHISWNARKAPHGMLVEFGHLQRYRYYQDEQGRVRPMVREGMQGKPRPRSGSRNRAALDSYYVTLPQPVLVAARPFIRPAIAQFDAALKAAEAEVLRRVVGKP